MEHHLHEKSMAEFFGEVIYSYSREQAIEDGVLVDVSATAREAGIKFPVAVTSEVWNTFVVVPEGVQGQDEAGRLWDIVWMLRYAITTGDGGSELLYDLHVRNNNRRADRVSLKAVCGPGDDWAPVITVMMPWED